jgi:hypothetical protein
VEAARLSSAAATLTSAISREGWFFFPGMVKKSILSGNFPFIQTSNSAAERGRQTSGPAAKFPARFPAAATFKSRKACRAMPVVDFSAPIEGGKVFQAFHSS